MRTCRSHVNSTASARKQVGALRGIVWVMWGHCESAGSPGTMIGTPTGVCLPGRVGSITLGHGTPTVDMASRWTPQNGVHRDLEISPRTRDSHIPTADPSWGRRGMEPASVLGGLQKIGVRRVSFTDGHDESWSYTLEPEDETRGGKMVLAQHGLGAPLALTRSCLVP